MNYRLETHEAVGDEVENGRLSYEQLRQGLGDQLFDEIYATMMSWSTSWQFAIPTSTPPPGWNA